LIFVTEASVTNLEWKRINLLKINALVIDRMSGQKIDVSVSEFEAQLSASKLD